MTRIILLSDGTGNAASRVWRTNVWRIFESLDLTGSNQVAIYDDGVGTSSFKPLAILGGAFGWGLKRNILDLYKFVCRNYQSSEDEIFGFGFSRGAFTMRMVVGLIISQGLIRYETEAQLAKRARDAYRAFRRENFHTVLRVEKPFRWLRDQLIPNSYHKSENRTVERIRFMGLWDSVAAYGLPVEEMTRGVSEWIWALELPERRLCDQVLPDLLNHFVEIDEVEIVLLGHGPHDFVARRVAKPDQLIVDLLAERFCGALGFGQLVRADDPLTDKNISIFTVFSRHGGLRSIRPRALVLLRGVRRPRSRCVGANIARRRRRVPLDYRQNSVCPSFRLMRGKQAVNLLGPNGVEPHVQVA